MQSIGHIPRDTQSKNREEILIAITGQKGLVEYMDEITRKSKLDIVIGGRVSAILEERKLTKRGFAKSVGIDDGDFRKLLKGRARWHTWHLDVVAKALNISPAELLEDKAPGRIHAGMLQAVISGLRKVQATGRYGDLSPETEARLISLLYDYLVEDELEEPEEKTIRRYLELVS